jgi:hypothetical protein
MGFLFFRKKGSEAEKALEHVNQISENLKHSFTRIKTDIKVVRDWLSFFKDKDDDYVKRFESLESRMEEMGQVISYIANNQQEITNSQKRKGKDAPYYPPDQDVRQELMKRTPLDDLTETQRVMFFRLAAFQRESGQEWTSLKTLAQDLYPGKPYDKVRSTVSEYVGILVDTGLIKKMRKGKQSYIAITSKGQEYFSKNRPKNKKKPIQKSK